MDEELRDSLMEWYLRFGERVVDYSEFMDEPHPTDLAYLSEYIVRANYDDISKRPYHITPEGIEALKNG